MNGPLTWLPDVLLAEGLKVAVVPGWESRSAGAFGEPLGVLCHQTIGRRQGNMPSLNVLVEGRSDLRGPLLQLGLGRDGTYYVIAAGRANHAGGGTWQGVTSGNTHFIGIEAENSGGDDLWPQIQTEAYHRGVAAILRHLGKSADFCAGHREYATPLGRKNDPNFDMDQFRIQVANVLAGVLSPLVPIPAVDPKTNRPTLRRSSNDPLVATVQRKLNVIGPPIFGPKTEAAVREFQRRSGMVADGIVGPKTWTELDKLP